MTTRPLTPTMQRALDIARRDGVVTAGKNVHRGRVERVAAPTITALICRGLLVHCYSSEGGYAGRLPLRAQIQISDHGSVVLFEPLTAKAHEWLLNNTEAEGWQWLGGSLAVEHRAAPALIQAIEEAL